MRFILGFLVAAVVAQQPTGKASMQQFMGKAKGKAQALNTAPVAQPTHLGSETTEAATPPVLINAVTDWTQALHYAIDNVPGVSNHHHARWLGLLGEVIYKVLSKNTNSALTSDVVASYTAHQFLSYNFPQFQSGYFDALLNVYMDYYNGSYPHREPLDTLVLPIVKKILVRETGRGIVNFVQNYVAPSTIGVDRATLEKYQGKYQFTDVPNDKVTVNYKDKPTQINWQERGHFGTIKPYFGPLIGYVEGLKPIVVGTPAYDTNLKEAQAFGSNDQQSKDKYNWETPFFWLNDWSRMPAIWTDIARAHLNPNMSNLETARAFATLGLGIFESCNTCYGMKWGKVSGTNALWRPITAIRSGDTFGHTPVATWTPQLSTPMHPEYPSGHCAHSSAAVEILRNLLGSDNITQVIKTDWSAHNQNSPAIANRKFTSLSSLEKDVANSRVLGGVHYRSSCDDAFVLGRRAAQASWSFFYPKK